VRAPAKTPSRPFHFRFALGFLAPRLASMLDSLVRVTRRVGIRHFANDRRGERNPGLPPDEEPSLVLPRRRPPRACAGRNPPSRGRSRNPAVSRDLRERPAKACKPRERPRRTPAGTLLSLSCAPGRSHAGTFRAA